MAASVGVVSGQAKLESVFVIVDVCGLKNRHTSGDGLRHRDFESQLRIGISHVTGRGHQHRQCGFGLGRPDKNRQVFLGHGTRFRVLVLCGGAQANGIDAAFQIDRHIQAQGRGPLAVGHGVVVKLDAAIFMESQAVAVIAAIPVPASLPPHRAIDPLCVQQIGTLVIDGVANTLVGIASTGVPVGQSLIVVRGLTAAQLGHDRFIGHPHHDAGSVDFAVETLHDKIATAGVAVVCACDQKCGAGCGFDPHARLHM